MVEVWIGIIDFFWLIVTPFLMSWKQVVEDSDVVIVSVKPQIGNLQSLAQFASP